MSSPKVYISILNWNGLDDTIECLESIFKLDYDNFHLVVVDNNSSDNSVSVLRKRYPNIHIIESRINTGFTGGNNIAIQYAIDNGADYVWLLNNDTVVECNTLTLIVETAGKNDLIGMVSPEIYYYDQKDKIQFNGSYISDENLTVAYLTNKSQLDDCNIKNKVILWGTALLIKRAVIKKVGYLDDLFFAYAEDCDYSIRVNNSGYINTICFNAKVFHKDSMSTGGIASPIQIFLRIRNSYFLKMRYLKPHKRIAYIREYIANAIESMAGINDGNHDKAVGAYLNGLWCAFRGVGGSFNNAQTMPWFFRKLTLFFVNWHPYFWTEVVRCNFAKVAEELKRRLFLVK